MRHGVDENGEALTDAVKQTVLVARLQDAQRHADNQRDGQRNQADAHRNANLGSNNFCNGNARLHAVRIAEVQPHAHVRQVVPSIFCLFILHRHFLAGLANGEGAAVLAAGKQIVDLLFDGHIRFGENGLRVVGRYADLRERKHGRILGFRRVFPHPNVFRLQLCRVGRVLQRNNQRVIVRHIHGLKIVRPMLGLDEILIEARKLHERAVEIAVRLQDRLLLLLRQLDQLLLREVVICGQKSHKQKDR